MYAPYKVSKSLYNIGFAIVLLEAMSASLPICAFGVVGVKGIVENNKTGLLCDFPNVDALALNLSILINDEKLRQTFGEAGHQKLAVYAVEKTMIKWQNLFNSILLKKKDDED